MPDLNEPPNPARKVLVAGATGQQGGAVARALLDRGHRVRALARNGDSPKARELKARGAEMAVGDFGDSESLVRAATGVDAVFAMTTPLERGVDGETEQGLTMLAAAARAGAGHLVYSSVASADRHTGVPHFDSKQAVEQSIAQSAVPYTIVAPVFFMDNLASPWFAPGIADGRLAMAMPGTTPLQQVAVADIGAFAAAVIERREAAFGRRYDIAGDELTCDEAAAALSEVTGRTVTYAGYSPDAMRAQSEDMALMYEWFESTGYSADIEGLRREFPEVPWQCFAEWARKQEWAPAPA